eukprot:COSAG01_NODE_558_length_15478_cov_217.596788_10_plen_72_part_00
MTRTERYARRSATDQWELSPLDEEVAAMTGKRRPQRNFFVRKEAGGPRPAAAGSGSTIFGLFFTLYSSIWG